MKHRFVQLWKCLSVLLILASISQISHADSVAKDQWNRSAVIGVPGSKEVIVKIIGLSADADLYVRKPQEPTLTEFDCRPALTGINDETCLIALNDGETAQIGVFGTEAAEFFLDINFVENQSSNSDQPKPLILGRKVPGVAQSNQFTYYVFDSSVLPALTDDYLVRSAQNYDGFGIEFVASLSNLSADADLFVGIGALPTISNGEDRCDSNKPGGTNDEQCGVFLKDLNGLPVYIGVSGDNTSATYNVQGFIQKTINVTPANIQMVSNGFSALNNVLKDQWKYYQVNPDLVSTASSITITMKPTANDVDLYVRTQAPPIALHWDCFANKSGTTEEVCVINNPAPDQAFYFGVFGFSSSNYNISVNIQ